MKDGRPKFSLLRMFLEILGGSLLSVFAYYAASRSPLNDLPLGPEAVLFFSLSFWAHIAWPRLLQRSKKHSKRFGNSSEELSPEPPQRQTGREITRG